MSGSLARLAAFSVAVMLGCDALAAQPESYGPPAKASAIPLPDHVKPYYSGPPCPRSVADRTFSQFQVNLARDLESVSGTLTAGAAGEALLETDDGRRLRLVSNASRVDWLLAYPWIDTEVRVVGRRILAPDCSVVSDRVYVEAIYPAVVLDDAIVPVLDLRTRRDHASLRHAVEELREALADGKSGSAGDSISRLERAMFEEEVASAPEPWRVVLTGPTERLRDAAAVDLVLSGSDGGAGLFGHVAVGIDDEVYNVYPKGSERGAPEAVSIGEYLFSATQGQVLRRPTWVLRIEGLPGAVVDEIREAIEREVEGIDSGENPYHPTRNNCVTACIRALEPVGIKVPRSRYFTRRFPRPIFSKVLHALPRLAKRAGPQGLRVELWYVPQVGVRPMTGMAPNRPMWDRTRVH